MVAVLTGYMVLDEVGQFVRRDEWVSTLDVDTRPIPEQHHMGVALDITFPSMQCGSFGFDVMDVTGELQLGAERQFQREPAGRTGCRMYGAFAMHRVNGEFHVAFGRMSQQARDTHAYLSATQRQAVGHVHLFTPAELGVFNASHTVNHLAFTDTAPVLRSLRGSLLPLLGRRAFAAAAGHGAADGAAHTFAQSQQGRSVYLLKVVPVELRYSSGRRTRAYEYTYSVQHTPITVGPRFSQPGVFFRYELSPYTVVRQQVAPRLGHTLASCAAIVAGMLLLTRVLSTYLANILDFVSCGHIRLPTVPPTTTTVPTAAPVPATLPVPVPGAPLSTPDSEPDAVPQQQQQPLAYLPYMTAATTVNRHAD